MSKTDSMQDTIHPPSMLDPKNRDPFRINKHLQLDFFNVIAEPDISAYNFEILQKVSHQVYHYTKIGIYRLLSTVIGLPLMLFWGLVFGLYTFLMIWLVVPSRRLFQSLIAEMGFYVQTASDAIIGPVHRSMGQIFSNINISLAKRETFSTTELTV